jgi:hypothetical protein
MLRHLVHAHVDLTPTRRELAIEKGAKQRCIFVHHKLVLQIGIVVCRWESSVEIPIEISLRRVIL